MEARIDDPRMVFSPNPELFFVRGKVVATQASYNMAFMGPNYHEVRYYYCPVCGDVWGQRIVPAHKRPRHFYINSHCREHGGDELMLNPFELRRTDILGPDVLALLFLHLSQEDNEDD